MLGIFFPMEADKRTPGSFCVDLGKGVDAEIVLRNIKP